MKFTFRKGQSHANIFLVKSYFLKIYTHNVVLLNSTGLLLKKWLLKKSQKFVFLTKTSIIYFHVSEPKSTVSQIPSKEAQSSPFSPDVTSPKFDLSIPDMTSPTPRKPLDKSLTQTDTLSGSSSGLLSSGSNNPALGESYMLDESNTLPYHVTSRMMQVI